MKRTYTRRTHCVQIPVLIQFLIRLNLLRLPGRGNIFSINDLVAKFFIYFFPLFVRVYILCSYEDHPERNSPICIRIWKCQKKNNLIKFSNANFDSDENGKSLVSVRNFLRFLALLLADHSPQKILRFRRNSVKLRFEMIFWSFDLAGTRWLGRLSAKREIFSFFWKIFADSVSSVN